MASSINASTSGGGGVITTADATGNLNIQSGGSTVVAVTSTGATVTGTLAATGAVSGTTGTFTGAVSGTTGVFTGAVTTPLSYVRLNTANGYGSTNTKIRRFTNIVNNVGTDITYADSATLGGTFTINTAGVYSANYCDQTTGISELGLSIDSTQLTTQINSITITNVLAITNNPGANRTGSVSATFYAAATSIVRAHTNGDAAGAGTAQCTQFTIARVQ